MPSYCRLCSTPTTRACASRRTAPTSPAPPSSRQPELDNTPLIAGILKLRREAAELLGFRSYAEVSLAAKMADTPAEVLKFLDELGVRARPYAEKDYAELKAFARDELGLADLQAWDTTYVSEKLSVARYSFPNRSEAVLPRAARAAGCSS